MPDLNIVKRVYSGASLCLIGLGVVLLFCPVPAAELFCRLCGGLLLLFGVVKLVGYFSRDLLQLAFQFDFAMGVLSCLFGLVLLFRPGRLMEGMALGLGVFLLADALLRVQTAIDARRIGVAHWGIILAVAIVTAALGAALMLRPYEVTRAAVMLLGLNLIIDGILNLYVVQNTVTIMGRRTSWEL